MARDVFTFRYLPQLGVTGQQRPAVGFPECQREGVRQRQPRTGSSVLDGEGHPVAVECFYPHAALPHVFTAEGLQFAFVEQVGYGEVEAKAETGREEGSPFEIDQQGRIRDDDHARIPIYAGPVPHRR